MSRPYTVRIRQHRPWRFRVRRWNDESGALQDPADYTWRFVASTTPPLDLAGVVADGDVVFSRTGDEAAELTPGQGDYAVKATPVAGGEPIYVFEGTIKVQRTTVA